MKRNTLVSALFGAAITAAMATSANALVVHIGLQEAGVSAGAITNVGTSNANLTYGDFKLNSLTGIAIGDLTFPELLYSTASDISTSAAGKTLTIYYTVQGLTTPYGAFQTHMTENNLTGGSSVNEATYFDAGNGLFATTNSLGSHLFTLQSTTDVFGSGNTGSNYSLTEVFTVTSTAIGQSFLSTAVVTAIPESSTWAMMLLGFLGMGFLGYRKSSKFPVPAFRLA